ncbi:MAG: hypothetical protein LBU20_02935 [Candidatus Nomurabacteria bacterium]|jgi:hypothetical protein|nr:hypothetical protein [Candidatus Nomurabacteria bacterium]
MSKKSKKRSKKYAGWDSRGDSANVTVHKLTAVNRPPLKQWLFEHKKLVRAVAIALGVVVVIILCFTVKI